MTPDSTQRPTDDPPGESGATGRYRSLQETDPDGWAGDAGRRDRTDGTGPRTSRARDRGRSPSQLATFLLGVHPRRAAVTGVAIVALAALHLASLYAAGLDFGESVQRFAPPSDVVAAVVIVVGLLAVVLGPLVVAWTTASPFQAFLVAQVPWAVGAAMATGWSLDVDVVVSLTTGAGGCALALYRSEMVRTGSARPWRVRFPPGEVALPAAVLIVVSFSLVTRFVALAPDGMVLAALPFSIYWLLVVGVGIPYAVAFVRSPRRCDRTAAT